MNSLDYSLPIKIFFISSLCFIFSACSSSQTSVPSETLNPKGLISNQVTYVDTIWLDDSIPSGSLSGSSGGDSWNWISSNPTPISGSLAHTSNISAGQHQHYFTWPTTPFSINTGDKIFTYIYLDPNNIPSEVMLEWHDGTSWEHRAYWGANSIANGTDGTASRYSMGALPAVGQWVRLEVPANLVGLEGKSLIGMTFTLFGGRATWDKTGKSSASAAQITPAPPTILNELVWVDDSIPTGSQGGAAGGDSWNWISTNPTPISGSLAHVSNISTGQHQHYFTWPTTPFSINTGDKIFTFIYLDPNNIPSEVMLEWHDGTSWEHRAYWGANSIANGTDGTASRYSMGALPAVGQWVRLEIPANLVGLEGKSLIGMTFTLFGGRATWDKTGKSFFTNIPSPTPPVQSQMKLALSGPSTGIAGTCIGPFTVTTKDSNNNLANVSANISIALTMPTSGNTYLDTACTTASSLSVPSGTATKSFYFKDTGYNKNSVPISVSLLAQASGYTSSTFSFYEVAGIPTQIIFLTQPSSAALVGAVLAVQPSVLIEDALGNKVNSSALVSLIPYSNASCTIRASGSLTGSNSITGIGVILPSSLRISDPSSTAVNGVASFSGISYSNASTIYLGASSSGLVSACSNAITVSTVTPPPPPPPPPGQGYSIWKNTVQPLLASKCNDCHIGERFGYASLSRAGSTFSETESQNNYDKFKTMISLDYPQKSRLIEKALPGAHPNSIQHAGGNGLIQENDSTYTTFLNWINQERTERCPQCGMAATNQFLAYVKQPNYFWSIARDPMRNDGARQGARIMLQKIDPASFSPVGSPIDFLAGINFCEGSVCSDSYCNDTGDCDFGNMSVSYSGTQMAFECKRPINGESWAQRDWNICIAGIDANGKAVQPHYLRPAKDRHWGLALERHTPFARYAANGSALTGVDDRQFVYRRRNDITPIFSPGDDRIYFASESPDPRTGEDSVETYHGDFHLFNIISTALDGSDAKTIYRSEGGRIDSPFFLKNGNLTIHSWNLDRMDRHMYTQMSADGQMEMPILFGRTQGPNRWGNAFQMTNGMIFGITGIRRGSIDLLVPFAADHTLGGVDPNFAALKILPQSLMDELQPYLNGVHNDDYPYCYTQDYGPNSRNCRVSQFFSNPAWSPDGRAFVSHNPDVTYLGNGGEGEDFYRDLKNFTPDPNHPVFGSYLPQKMGISIMDQKDASHLQIFLHNDAGYMYRYPQWVGKREAPKIQPWKTDESQTGSILHIADFKLWLSFQIFPPDAANNVFDKTNQMAYINTITSVRVLSKEMGDQACIRDDGERTMLNDGEQGNHPTSLGMVDSTGFTQYVVPTSLGGNAHGDIDLQADDSIKLKIPKGKILYFQGIDANGHAAFQHTRLFGIPPGQVVNTSVKRSQYDTQCVACHGTLSRDNPYIDLAAFGHLSTQALDFNTAANAAAPVDLTSPAIVRREMTYLGVLRPLLDKPRVINGIDYRCTSCHTENNGSQIPAAELTFDSQYSFVGNFPKASWAFAASAPSSYINSVPQNLRRPSYDFSVSYSWLFNLNRENGQYPALFPDQFANQTALSNLAPYDPGYQNLWRRGKDVFGGDTAYYLNQIMAYVNVGRSSDLMGGISSLSYLISVLINQQLDKTKPLPKVDHSQWLTEDEKRIFMGVVDLGMPYMATCNEKIVQSGPYTGLSWGEAHPQEHQMMPY
ncbi:MAG: hypothetical protein JWQ35_767 [Bacteriovoracaceae bacterium]|nr:hypothetical protein [Bacteriovoracaceae bacterium]